MPLKLSPSQIRNLRLAAQRLTSQDLLDPTQLLTAICGVQAQEMSAARLAIRVRTKGLTNARISTALEQQRTIVRTWAMRGTLHLLPAGDLAWLLPLLGPVFIRESRHRLAELGLAEQTCARSVKVIVNALKDRGPLTRVELAHVLQAEEIPAAGQGVIHLIRRAALEGFVCYGPTKSGEQAFALLSDWTGIALQPPSDQHISELAWRYFRAYGPARIADLASWSGLPQNRLKVGIAILAAELVEVETDRGLYWMCKDAQDLNELPQNEELTRLLPGYDTYLLGYSSRSSVLDDKYARRIHPGGGIIRPAVIVDGHVVARWQMSRKPTRVDITVEPFDHLPAPVENGILAEAEDIGRFLGLDYSLKMTNPE